MKCVIPPWVLKLKESIPAWLEQLREQDSPFGKFRFAREGCVYLPYDIISVHFVADIYEKLNLINTLSARQKQEWIDLSLSYRDSETGLVCDPEGIEKSFTDSNDINILRRNLNRVCIGVFGSWKGNLTPLPEVKAFLDKKKMYEAFDAEPWEDNSWSAGAHCAHYIAAMRTWVEAGHKEFESSIQAAVEYLYAKQNSDTGTFGGNTQDTNCLIGGILKIYTRLFGTLGLEVRYPQKIIDTTLEMLRSGELQGNCPVHNALIVLAMCRNFTDHRADEITKEAYESLERDIRPLLKNDGAFGLPDILTSGYSIWDVKMVEPGYDQSEIHSTVIMIHAIRVCLKLLDKEGLVDWTPLEFKQK